MKKPIFLIIVFLALLIIAYVVYTKLFDRKLKFDLTEKESKVLIDSIKIDESTSLYWFKFESYVGSTSVSFIGINKMACDCNIDNAILKGEFIEGIKEIKEDSIYIISRYGFQMLQQQNSYHFVDVRTDANTDSIKHIKGYVYFRDLCK